MLRSDAAHLEMQAIAGFYASMGGRATPFWFAPPNLSNVTGQLLGQGDGTTTSYRFTLTIGERFDRGRRRLQRLRRLSRRRPAAHDGWSFSSAYPPTVTFVSAPPAGAVVSADFGALWLCRFADDALDFEEFMTMLFELRTLRLTAVRP